MIKGTSAHAEVPSNYNNVSKVSRIALIKSKLFNSTGFGMVEMPAKDLVILPSSIVLRVARSNLSANAHNSGVLSNSPRFRNAPCSLPAHPQ